ncbi:MAG: tetratricopeptide repeat protein [Deltaproteobacteria bacterium]|nr:tetratricopeptide repeat protein [Deltaproteobacteria bacterium]
MIKTEARMRYISSVIIMAVVFLLNPSFARAEVKDADAYINRGNAYYKKGQHDRAIEDFNKAIALNPKLAEVYSNRGLAYGEKGQLDRTISDVQKACDMGYENGCKGLQMVKGR